MNTERIWENLAESIRIEKDGTTIPVPVEDIRALLEDRNAGSNAKECTDTVAVAIAVAADADYWTDEIAEWEGAEAWYRKAYPDEHPHTAYEDREQFRKQARAALRVANEVR